MNQERTGICRWVMLGSVFVALVLVAVAGIAWHYQRQFYVAAIEAKAERIVRFSRSLAQLPELKAQQDRMQTDAHLNTAYLKQHVPALAGAELLDMVKAAIEQAGGRLQSSRILNSAKDGPAERIQVSLRLDVSESGIEPLLLRLETHRPLLFIQQLDIRAMRRGQKGAAPQPQELTINLDVTAYMRTAG